MGNSNDYAGAESRFCITCWLVSGQAGSNLIGDDEVIPTKYQPGDADALTLTARKILPFSLMRVFSPSGRVCPVGQTGSRKGTGYLLFEASHSDRCCRGVSVNRYVVWAI